MIIVKLEQDSYVQVILPSGTFLFFDVTKDAVCVSDQNDQTIFSEDQNFCRWERGVPAPYKE